MSDLKYCWKCEKNLARDFFTESRWDSDSNTSLCAKCACDLQKDRYSTDETYRESKKRDFKDNYDREKERLRKREYRKRLKDKGRRAE